MGHTYLYSPCMGVQPLLDVHTKQRHLYYTRTNGSVSGEKLRRSRKPGNNNRLKPGVHHLEPSSPIQTLWDNLCAYLFIFRNLRGFVIRAHYSNGPINKTTKVVKQLHSEASLREIILDSTARGTRSIWSSYWLTSSKLGTRVSRL